jgi:hypothetical protein
METNRSRLALFEQIQKKNAAIEGAETGEKRIVFMGDSITEFWSSIQNSFRENPISRGN